jgi:hypothetical protein
MLLVELSSLPGTPVWAGVGGEMLVPASYRVRHREGGVVYRLAPQVADGRGYLA